MVPDGWKLTSLGEVCDGNLKTGPFGSQLHAYEYVEDGVPVIMPKDLIGCRVNIKTAAKITKERTNDLRKHVLEVGDLLFSRRGDVARFALIDEVSSESLCGTGCLRARPSEKHSSAFLSYFLQKNAVKKWLEQNAVGQTMPNMNTAILFELPLVVASSKAEEDKIARILSTWDRAIEITEKLISNSQQQKKFLMQQLLTGKKRLPGFSEKWDKVHLIECAISLDNKRVPLNAEQRLKMIGDIPYWGANGIVGHVNDFIFDETIVLLAEDGGYFDEYSTRPIANISYGKAWVNNHAHILKAKSNATNEWIYYSFVHKNILGYVNVGTRAKLNKKDMLLIPILLPSIKEQKKITSVLSSADKEIETLQQKLEYLKQEKKALMQQLLTGKRRVKIDAEDLQGEVA